MFTDISFSVTGGFLHNSSRLWPNGVVTYRFEMMELEDGVMEHIFRDSDMAMINKSMKHIEREVPCIEFR